MEYRIIPKQMVSVLFVTSVLLQMSAASDKIYFPDEVPSLIDTLGTEGNAIQTRFSFINNEDFCQMTTGDLGRCIPYSQCPSLVRFVARNGFRNRNTVQFLRSRICRFLRNDVHLCCPVDTAAATSNAAVTPLRTNTGASSSLLPSQDECGVSSADRIVKGIEISPGAHPWLVGIGFPSSNTNFRVLCGGTLITRKHVITASHCFVPRPGFPRLTHVRLGEHSLSRSIEREPPITLRIAGRVSPGYNPRSQVNDIELVTLEREVTFTGYIRPACLPFGLRGTDVVGRDMTIIGWGDTFFRSNAGSDVPLAANITVIPKATCREAYSRNPEIPLDNTQICAAGGDKDSCQGDSGGPLIYMEQVKYRRYFLMGVVSFGIECANPLFPGVYTYIPEFLDFITNNLSR